MSEGIVDILPAILSRWHPHVRTNDVGQANHTNAGEFDGL